MKFMKILTILGMCISFGFTVDSMASVSACNGHRVMQCSPGKGGVPSGQTCSGYYIPPLNPILCAKGSNNNSCGIYCSGSPNDCTDDGPLCL
jgi:hypothetical protein